MGYLFFVGLVITSVATGSLFVPAAGFLVLGIGIMLVAILGYLNGFEVK